MFFADDFLEYVAWDGGRDLPAGESLPRGLAAIGALEWLLLGKDTLGIYRTMDGGTTWGAKIAIPAAAVEPGDLAAINEVHWLVVNASQDARRGIYRTTDGGTTWGDKIAIPAAAINPQALAAVDQKTWLLGDNSTKKIYRTTDGGTTWDAGVSVPNVLQSLLGMSVIDATTWIVSGSAVLTANQVQMTRDGGATWSPVASPALVRYPDGISVVDESAWLLACSHTDKVYAGYLFSSLERGTRFRGLSGNYDISFIGGAPGLNQGEKLYAFADGLADASGAAAPTLGEPRQDPYLRRYRVLKEFNAPPPQVNFGRFSSLGTLLFFRESAVVRADSRYFFVTYPFNVRVGPRATYVPLGDNSQKEVKLTDERYVTFTINAENAFDDHVEDRDKVISMISSDGAFVFSDGDPSGPNHYLFRRESRRALNHNHASYNRQNVSVTVEAL